MSESIPEFLPPSLTPANLQQQVEQQAAELARIRDQLQRTESLHRQWAALVQSSDDAIIGKTLDGTIVTWNPGAERLFGYPTEEVLGQSIDILLPIDQSQAMPGIMERIRLGEHVKHYETVRVRKDGTPVDVSLGISPIKDATDNIVGMSTIARDITERKRTERLLNAQHATTKVLASSTTVEESLPKILKSICESIGGEVGLFWGVDQQAGVLRCLAEWHSRGAKAVSLIALSQKGPLAKNEGLPGQVWVTGKPSWTMDITQGAQLPRTAAAAQGNLHGALAYPVRAPKEVLGVLELFGPHLEKPDAPLLAMLATIGSQIGQFIGRKQTESQLRQTEEQFRQAQKMEAIGLLAGGVAHDFNNLLTGILGYSDLLLSELKPSDPYYEEMMEIRKAAERASLLTQQLLAFSRKQVLAPKVLDVNTIITDTERMLHRLIGEDIQLVTVLAPNLGKIKADPGQVEQVILNLAVNARDAMPKGGKLTIETANVHLDHSHAKAHPEVTPGQYVLLAVRDTGGGMSEATKARIFEPFFTTKEFGKGTGLGLATVFGIVKHGGGHIEVESQLERGTTFRIYFPRNEAVVPLRKSYPGLHKAPAGQETVLLVEDEEVVRTLTRKTLQKCGYTVLEASGPEESDPACQATPGADPSVALGCRHARDGRWSASGAVARFAAGNPGVVHVGIHG